MKGFSTKNKIDPSFNMSSMTDMVFLLLIFFMLTSNFATPSGIKISVPTSESSTKVIPKVNVTITKELKYYINEVQVPFDFIEQELKSILPEEEGVVVLLVDKDVPVQHLINVAGIATKLKAKVSIATKPIKSN